MAIDDTPDDTPWNETKGAYEVAGDLLKRAPQDLVFNMQFLGESQYRLHTYFRDFITQELSKRGITHDQHPMLQFFIDAHATELRGFVFSGVGLERQFRIAEIEHLTGDPARQMRMEIWDALVNHIETAETSFLKQADDLPALIERIKGAQADAPGGGQS